MCERRRTVGDLRRRQIESGDEDNKMTWLFLVLAILLEVSGTTCMKFSEGFTRTLPSILLLCFTH